MINQQALKELIEQYKADFPYHWDEEKYKWQAVKHFRDHWDINAPDFGKMFLEATRVADNLLKSGYAYPRDMIIRFWEVDKEATRQMFRDLFDGSGDMVERIEKFGAVSDELLARYDVNHEGKHHYQDNNAICTYLWLHDPDKYYIYKYSTVRAVAKALGSDFRPTKGHRPLENITRAYEMYNDVRAALQKDEEFCKMLSDNLDDSCWKDESLRTATQDFGFFVQKIMRPVEKPDIWKISHGSLSEEHRKIFRERNVVAIHGTTKPKGGSKVSQGEDFIENIEEGDFFYLCYGSSIQLFGQFTSDEAVENPEKQDGWFERPYRVIAESKDTSPYTGTIKWWTPNENSTCIRVDDKKQFEKLILKPYFDLRIKELPGDERGCWWLNANPEIWSLSDMPVGGVDFYTLYNKNNNKRRIFKNFLDAKVGDPVIGYEASPEQKIVALAKIAQESDGEKLYFEKREHLAVPIEYSELKDCPELQKMEFMMNPNGSLFKLTKEQHEFIMEKIREKNPSVDPPTPPEKYDREKFLADVYITEEEYDNLRELLEYKLNVILQGPPGVGKTFAAKRLAYSIMGEKDDSRIEFVQFHQNYSYEDFVMGYKPSGDGFSLEEGIFFKFCKRAAADPDPNKKYFFIIDEINRGNMSKIFGELLMLIENDKRGDDYRVTLPYTGKSFSIPKNLYIIGMMNTADRSLAMIDYALRRRFAFFTMKPAFEKKGFQDYLGRVKNEKLGKLIEQVKKLNKAIAEDKSLGKDFCIGHSYFCGLDDDKNPLTPEEIHDRLAQIVNFEIKPMINEYCFDDSEKNKEWTDILDGKTDGKSDDQQ